MSPAADDSSVLAYERNVYFTGRYHEFLMVDARTHQNGGAMVLPMVGHGIDGLLHAEEVAASVLCHHQVVVADVRSQGGHDFGNGVYGQPGHGACALYIEMGVVFTSLGHGGYGVGRYPHEQLLRLYWSQAFHQFVGYAVHVYKGNVQFAGHVAGRIQIGSVGVYKAVAFLRVLGARLVLGVRVHTLAYVVLADGVGNGIAIGSSEVAAHNGVEQHGYAALSTCFVDKAAQIVVEGGSGVGMSFGIGLLVVVSELDEDVVALPDERKHLVPAAFVYEALGAAAIYGMIVNTYFLRKESRQHLPPASLGVAALQVFVGHGGVANHKYGYHGFIGLEGRKDQKQAQKQNQLSFHAFHIICPPTIWAGPVKRCRYI